jgi:hypothetical protein
MIVHTSKYTIMISTCFTPDPQRVQYVASICTLSAYHALCIKEYDPIWNGICDPLGSHKQVMPLINLMSIDTSNYTIMISTSSKHVPQRAQYLASICTLHIMICASKNMIHIGTGYMIHWEATSK